MLVHWEVMHMRVMGIVHWEIMHMRVMCIVHWAVIHMKVMGIVHWAVIHIKVMGIDIASVCTTLLLYFGTVSTGLLLSCEKIIYITKRMKIQRV